MSTSTGDTLLAHYRKDPLTVSPVKSFIAAHRLRSMAEDNLREYLADATNLAPANIDALIASLHEAAKVEAPLLSPAAMLGLVEGRLKTMVKLRIDRDQHAILKAERDAKYAPKATLRALRNRKITIFANETLTSSVGAVLAGAPDLVDRAMTAVRYLLTDTTECKILWLREKDDSLIQDLSQPRTVAYNSPWWHQLFINRSPFHKMVDSAARTLGGLDVILVDDVGLRSSDPVTARKLPVGRVTRATAGFERAESLAKKLGGIAVVGLKLSDTYNCTDMNRLSEKCRMYRLSEEGGLLYATDGFGKEHLIAEPGDICYDPTANQSHSTRRTSTTSAASQQLQTQTH